MNRTRRTCLALLPAALALALPHARAAEPLEVEGLRLPGRLSVADTELRLNGAGVRAVAWFKGYVAALYLPERTRLAAQAIEQPGPKRLQLQLLVDVPAGEFVKALDRGLRRNTGPEPMAALRPAADELGRRIAALGTVRKGDVIDLDWVPAQGMLLQVNGTLRGLPLAEPGLYPALLRAFLGDKPYDPALKAALLRAAPSD
jgi:hypothetical protein